jgi:methyl-accepting chemotaxis protein
MNWLKDRKIGTKFVLGFGTMIVLLAINVVISYSAITTIRDSQQRLFEQEFAGVVEIGELRADLNRQRALLLEMTITTNRDELDALARDIRSRTTEIDDSLQKLASILKNNNRSLSKLDELRQTNTAYRQAREAQIRLIFDGRSEEARQSAEGTQSERFVKIRDLSIALGNEMIEESRRQLAASAELAARSLQLLAAFGGIALFLGLALAAILNRLISRPLRDLTTVAERITLGDLRVNVSTDRRNDEVGVLARTFDRMTQSLGAMAMAAEQIAAGDLRSTVKPQSPNDALGNAFARMSEDLREQIRGLIEGANVLSSAASEIVASTAELAASASESAAAVSETTTTVEEVRQTAQVASQKATQVSDSAQRAVQISQTGRQSTADVGAGMTRIRQQMEAIAASMVRLSEQSQAIGQIIATVEDLAAQSNLLAVNAAIEAAKAGEQGKGFAVVAQEVKSLAEQSRAATGQVRTMLTDIQKATATAVMATEQGSKAVEAGAKQTEVAGEAIQALAASVNEAAGAASQIAVSSQQQLVGVDQVAGAMDSIKQASAQNVAGAKQLETAARNLNELGQRIKTMVARYQV